jgi:gold/copper resistance efflux system membrane fusion protein
MAIKKVGLIWAAIGLSLILAGCEDTQQSASEPKPPSVPVAEVIVRPVAPFVEFTGSLSAIKQVELRPRVAGYIQEVSVPEGRLVEKGSRLFLIDPRPFKAALDAAMARLRESEASLMLAQAEFLRAEQLFAKKVVAQDRLDRAIASRNIGRAQVAAAKAAVDVAQLELSFTRVTSPISGRVGRTLITEGNYVTNGVTPLTTIVSVDPLYVYFDVDERTYLRSLDQGRTSTLKVGVALLTDQGYLRSSRLDFLSNVADRGTGTVRARALVDNPDGQLKPGLFARVRLETGDAQTRVLISDQSVGTDQGSRYVLVVDENDKTQYRPVDLGPMVDGLRVITQGLQAGERIVVKGLVRPDMQITPEMAEIDGTTVEVAQAVEVSP